MTKRLGIAQFRAHKSEQSLSINEILKAFKPPVKIRADHWADGVWYELRGIAPIGRRESIGWFDNGRVVGYHPDQKTWEVIKNGE
jgi:hypothetical protein